MTKNIPSILLFLIIDCFLLIVSFNHIPSLIERSTFPVSVQEKEGAFIIGDVAFSVPFTVDDTIVAVI